MQRRHHNQTTQTTQTSWSRAPLLVLALVLLAGCWLVPRGRKIQDVTVAERIVLQAVSDSPARIELRIRGRIEGVATLTLLMEDKPYKTGTLEGEVNLDWGGDWYHPEAVMEYKPEGVQGGRLQMTYRF